MKALVLLLPLLVFAYGGWLLGHYQGKQKERLNRADRVELSNLREMRDVLMKDALDRIEVEPLAVTILDTIRTYEKKLED